MAALLSGKAFYDSNHNGRYDTGEPGIPGVYVVLHSAEGCRVTQTDASGGYQFPVTAAGAYSLYETAEEPAGECPPEYTSQPGGYNVSNGAKKLDFSVTAAQIGAGTELADFNFAHDIAAAALSCGNEMILFTGRPAAWYDVNVVTGGETLHAQLADDINAVAYNPMDEYLYGYDQTLGSIARIDSAGTLYSLSLIHI